MIDPVQPDVTVCIPAYQAAEFIDRTLRCARAQTHDALRIAVSIDLSEDETEQVCLRHAREDSRVEVHAHRERLGWAGNVNHLLEQVQTEFAFVYFHDDLIEPTYVERLLAALRERPDAGSANCDVQYFGRVDRRLRGHGYEGPAAERLLAYMVLEERDPLERSMIRMAISGHLRLPAGSGTAFEANLPYLMALVAAGPVLHVDEPLYRRWHLRGGGLTDAWRTLPLEDVLRGHRANAEAARRVIDDLEPSEAQRECLLFGLFIFMSQRLPRTDALGAAGHAYALEHVLPDLGTMALPRAVRRLPEPLRGSCEKAYDRVLEQAAKRALRAGDHNRAVELLEILTQRHPDERRPWAQLARALRVAGRIEAAKEARRTAKALSAGEAELTAAPHGDP